MSEIKPEQVPDAVARAMKDAMLREGSTFKDIAAAALNAWPGMMTACDLRLPDGRLVHIGGAIILPLPQEASDERPLTQQEQGWLDRALRRSVKEASDE